MFWCQHDWRQLYVNLNEDVPILSAAAFYGQGTLNFCRYTYGFYGCFNFQGFAEDGPQTTWKSKMAMFGAFDGSVFGTQR